MSPPASATTSRVPRISAIWAARWCGCGTTERCRRTIPSSVGPWSAGPRRGRRSSPGAIAIPKGSRCIPKTGRIWEIEHGPRGGDELNLLKPGANYGWPKATGDIDYDGSVISPYKTLPGMEDPIRTWVPSISPSGLCFYTGTAFPAWKGSLFTGGLSAYALFRIELDGERTVGEERLIEGRLP